MVWAVTDRGGTSADAVSNPSVGDVFTPAEDNIVGCVFQDNAGLVTGMNTSWGTWVEVGTLNMGGGYVADVWAVRVGASPGSDQVAVTTSSAAYYDAAVFEISGIDSVSALTAVFAQMITEISYNGGTDNAISTGFASGFASATNATLLIQLSRYNLQTFVAPTGQGFTSVAEQGGGRGAIEVFIEEAEVTNPEYSPVTAPANDGAIAFELLEGAAGARITAVDSPVLDAEVNSGVTTTGFGSAINSITIETAAGVNEIDLSASIAGSAGSWTYDMPSIYNTAVNLAGTPMDSASYTHTITLGDGTDTDSEVIVVNPTTGWLVRELVSPVKTAGSAFENFIGIPISGDQCLYPTANITSVAADGILTTDQISGTISMVFWDSTGEMALNGLFNVDDYWTYPPATWRITGGGAEHYANGSGDIYQTPEIDIVAGGTYEFTLIVSGYTAGTATIGLVGGIAVNGTARSANGTFVESLVAVTGNNLIRVASNVTGRFTIDSISVKRTDVPSGIYKPFTITIGAGGATYSKSRFGMMNSFGKFG